MEKRISMFNNILIDRFFVVVAGWIVAMMAFCTIISSAQDKIYQYKDGLVIGSIETSDVDSFSIAPSLVIQEKSLEFHKVGETYKLYYNIIPSPTASIVVPIVFSTDESVAKVEVNKYYNYIGITIKNAGECYVGCYNECSMAKCHIKVWLDEPNVVFNSYSSGIKIPIGIDEHDLSDYFTISANYKSSKIVYEIANKNIVTLHGTTLEGLKEGVTKLNILADNRIIMSYDIAVGDACLPNFENGHEYVDLGLPSGTKWATMNVGADSINGKGILVAWGEAHEKHCYGPNKQPSLTCEAYTGDIWSDAAAENWGGYWMLPTKEDVEELFEYCKESEGSYVGPNGHKIYLPSVDFVQGVVVSSFYTYYWTSTGSNEIIRGVKDDLGNPVYGAYSFWDNKTSVCRRYQGNPVRAVLRKK